MVRSCGAQGLTQPLKLLFWKLYHMMKNDEKLGNSQAIRSRIKPHSKSNSSVLLALGERTSIPPGTVLLVQAGANLPCVTSARGPQLWESLCD